MNTKHRWYDVIVAWANGEKIQFRNKNYTDWTDYTSVSLVDFELITVEWRVKPKTITKKYRMALVEYTYGYDVNCFDITNNCIDDPAEYSIQGFIRWVSDTVEVEIESD